MRGYQPTVPFREGDKGKISVALPALTQGDFSPNKTTQWPIFLSVKYEVANLNTTCPEIQSFLGKSRDGIFTERDQSQFDLDIDFSYPMPSVVSCSTSKNWYNLSICQHQNDV